MPVWAIEQGSLGNSVMLIIVRETTLFTRSFSAQLSALTFKGTFSPSVLIVALWNRPTGTKQEADASLHIRPLFTTRQTRPSGRLSAGAEGNEMGALEAGGKATAFGGGGGRRDLGI